MVESGVGWSESSIRKKKGLNLTLSPPDQKLNAVWLGLKDNSA